MNGRLKELRLKIGLSQSDFARKLLMSQNQLSLIELGKRNLTNRTINDICREFNVNEHWIRTGEGNIFNTDENKLNNEIANLVEKIQRMPKEDQDKIIRMIDIYLEK